MLTLNIIYREHNEASAFSLQKSFDKSIKFKRI